MNPTTIRNANRVMQPPRDWDESKNGPCAPLPVLYTGEFFQSAWLPDPQEIECMRAGAPVIVTIWGQQLPPHAVSTMPRPGYVTIEAYEAAFAALRNLVFMCRTASGTAIGGDAQLYKSVELAESVVGQIPADARRRDGDPDALKVNPPQGTTSEEADGLMRAHILYWRKMLEGVPVESAAFEAARDMDSWLRGEKR